MGSPDDTRIETAATEAGASASAPEREATGPGDVVHATALPKPGEAIGRFVVLEALGHGGMGSVLAAYDPELDRKVAVKLLRASWGSSEPWRRRLVQEARALARLSHPNVVAVHDVGVHQGAVFIAMEHVAGPTLRAWLKLARHPAAAILGVFAQAGRGLAEAHQKGLVHRDFKPDNVIVGDDGRVRVMDFGLAKSFADTAASDSAGIDSARPIEAMTQTGFVMGTPRYMAPEQWRGEPLDAQTDQFAFCVALHEALFDEHPFGDATGEDLARAVKAGRLRPLPGDTATSPRIAAAVRRGLAAAPTERHPSMAALLHALDRAAAPRSRRIAVAVALGTIAVATVVGLRVQRAGRLAECERLSGAASAAWNDTAVGTVRERMTATAVPYAASAFRSTAEVVDAYVARWAAERREVCLDGAVTHARAPETNALAADCLDERLRELEALVAALHNVTAAHMGDTIESALALQNPAECTDEARLAERARWPITEDQRPVVTELHRALSDARQAAMLGEGVDAHAMADAVARDARALGWPPIVADSEYTLGQALELAGREEEAKLAMRRSFLVAEQHGLDHAAYYASLALARIAGLRFGDTADALLWTDIAEAIRLRAGRAENDEVWRLRGIMHVIAGEAELGAEELDRAIALCVATYGEDHPATAIAVQTRCNAHDELGELDAALACHLRALDVQRTMVGEDHPAVAIEIMNVALAYSRKGELEPARAFAEQALAAHERFFGSDHPDTATARMNFAAMLARVGETADAIALLEQGIAAQDASTPGRASTLANALTNLALLRGELGEDEEAERRALEAIAVLERHLGAEHLDLAPALTALTTAQRGLGRLGQAEATARRVLALLERGPDPTEAAFARVRLGAVLLERGELDGAQLEMRPAYEVLLARLGRDNLDLAEPERAMARLAAARRDTPAALEHARRSVAVAERGLGPTHHSTVDMLASLGRLELDLGETEAAARTLERTRGLIDHHPSPALRAAVELDAAKVAWLRGDHARALEIAAAARDRLLRLAPAHAEGRQEIEAWLRRVGAGDPHAE